MRKPVVLVRSLPILALVAALLPTLANAPAGSSPASLTPAAGLPDGACAGLRAIPLPGGQLMCTHGPDPAPAGVDFRIPQPLAGGGHPRGLILPDPPGTPEGVTAQATPGVACHGDGQSGNRVQAVYAFPADRPDRYAQVTPSISQWAAGTDAVFQSSAAKTGGQRRISFVTDGACNLSVLRVALTARGDDTFDNTLAEFSAQGLNSPSRKYLVWMDSTVLCGIASYYVDERPGAENVNNGRPGVPGSVSRTDSGCWGLGSRGQSVEAHELMHSLGSIQPTAPNASAAGHCDDDSDRMCYLDGSVLVLRNRCPTNQEALFDCGDDDYFHAAPGPGNYLASHWNTASSSFLIFAETESVVSIANAVLEEGDSGAVGLTFTVALSPPAIRAITVRFATGDGTATSPGDYQAAGGTLSLAIGESARTLTVAVPGDVLKEDDETFTVTLDQPVNARLGRAGAVGTIIDNEPKGQGYWFVAADGGIFSYGDSKFRGSTGATKLNQPVVGMARTATGHGYWLVARDGGIFSFGDAEFFGSTGATRLNQPIVGMTGTPSGHGYRFVAADGGIFSYGDAGFFGSAGGMRLSRPVVAMAATPTGRGYWLVTAAGAVYAFGDAPPLGSGPGTGAAVVGMAATPTGGGYWLATADGALYAFGDAAFLGGAGGLNQPIVGLAATPTGRGYWLVARDGGIFSFGDARFFGSTGAIRLNQPIVGMAPAPGPPA